MSALLDVTNLRITYRGQPIVDGVDFCLSAGEALGLAGESGCGKTSTALALMRLLPPELELSGAMTLRPHDSGAISLERRTEAGMRVVRWRHISLIFQGAMNGFDPVRRVGAQIADAIHLHDPRADRAQQRARVGELLEMVGLTAGVDRRYAHQLSGGQRQRAMIALALACRPKLVIADEPTTALDVISQAQILELLERLRSELGLALLLISHDLGVLAQTCDRIAIMYAGRIVESGPLREVFEAAQHPYTKLLLDSLPTIGGSRELAPIEGVPPDPANLLTGCRFQPRCPYATSECEERDPPTRDVGPKHAVACHLAPWSRWPEPADTQPSRRV